MALKFNGAFIDCGNHVNYDLTNEGTIQVIMSITALPSSYESAVLFKGNIYDSGDSTWRSYMFGNIRNDYNTFSNWIFVNTSGFVNSDSLNLFTLGVPYVMTFAFGEGLMKNYKNGELYNSVNYFGNLNQTGNLYIGSGFISNGPQERFRGVIQEIRIWNQKLTDNEIRQYENKYLTGTENGLVALFRFNEGTGNTVKDSITGQSHTIQGDVGSWEWVEDLPPRAMFKSLIKSNNQLYSLDQDYNFIPIASPTLENFQTYGLDSLNGLVTPKTKMGYKMNQLGDGISSKTITPEKLWRSIQGLEVK